METKSKSQSSFNDLKRNFAEVVVSPRVDDIPAAYRITLFTHALIIGASLGFAFAYTAIASQTLCQAKALGDTADNTCGQLVTRKELFAKGDLNTSTRVDQSFTIDFSLRMNDIGGAVTGVSSFLVSEELSSAIRDQLVQAIDVDKVPFNKSSEVIAFYQSLGNLTDTFPMAFDTDVPDVLVDGADVANLKDDVINGGAFIDPDSSAFNLVVTWQNDAGTIDCALENFFDPTATQKARNVITCESIPNAKGDSQVVFQWISGAFELEDYMQLVLNFYAFITNVQRPQTGNFDSQSQKVIKNFFSINFFECCAPSSLDTLDYFGIFSGIGFLFEGVFVFVVTYLYFGGEVSKSQVAEMRKEEKEKATGGIGDEIIKSQKEEYEERNFTASKIVRVVFNPRCRYIPFPSAVSFASLVTLLGVSAIGAYFYQQAETQIVCSPTVRSEIGSQSCSSIVLDNHVYNSLTSSQGVLLPVGISATLDVEAKRLNDFQVAEIYRADAQLLQATTLACEDESLAECIRNLGIQLAALGDVSIEEVVDDDGRTEVNLEFENVTSIGNIDVTILVDIVTTVPQVNQTSGKFLEVFYEFQESSDVGVVIDYSASYSSTFEQGPEKQISLQQDGGNLVLEVLTTAGTEQGAAALVVNSFDNTFVQCCSEQSLLYFDYWGLMIGFVALGEGILTLIVALVVYLVLGLGCKRI